MSTPTRARCALCGAVSSVASALDHVDRPDGTATAVCKPCVRAAERAAWHVALEADPGAVFTPVLHVDRPGLVRVVFPANDNVAGGGFLPPAGGGSLPPAA